MKRSLRVFRNIIIVVIAVLILIPTVWFVGTRFFVDQYQISYDWDTIAFGNDTYFRQNQVYNSDAEAQIALDDMTGHIGKNIGIAVFPKRSFVDLIWPVWIMEYGDDTSHDQIFVRGLMDVGSIYVKVK